MSWCIEDDRARQIERFRDGLRAKITALCEAVESLDTSGPATIESATAIRRIAGQLQATSAALGLGDIASVAAVAVSAPAGDIAGATRALMDVLERVSRPETPPAELPPAELPPAELPPAELLIVEDSPVLVELLSRALGSSSCRIQAVSTAAQARARLAERSFDLVILDLILPDEDGRNLLLHMQDRVTTAATPVIVLSARGGLQTKTECLALGAEQYFEKPFDRVFLSAVANTIQRQRLRADEAREDLLTGLPNRAQFRELFARALIRARKDRGPIALAMLDLDRFDQVSARYGAAASDDLLRRMGLFLYGELRHVDTIARWGTDEFAVVLPGLSAERAAVALRRIQDSLRLQEGLPLLDGRRVQIPFSGGVVEVSPAEDLDAALARADQLLYLAKATGRDRILDAVPEIATRPQARILLVEDDSQVATLVGDLLGEQGFEVTWCHDAESALTSAQEHTHNLAILDRKLPRMDGFELLARLRKRERSRDMPVLVLTTMGSDSEIERAFELGADDYVPKPFRHRELVARIRRLLKRTDHARLTAEA